MAERSYGKRTGDAAPVKVTRRRHRLLEKQRAQSKSTSVMHHLDIDNEAKLDPLPLNHAW